jgi:hypothetical protein
MLLLAARAHLQEWRGGVILRTMHSRHFILFGAIVCILAMLAYLFVFADAPDVINDPPTVLR